MVPVPRTNRVRTLSLFALCLGFGLAGCGGGNEAVQVNFPDVSKASAPPVVGKAAAGVGAGPVSQGDPSNYSQAK